MITIFLTDTMNCNKKKLSFQDVGKLKVIGSFDGGVISSDAGALLLKEVEAKVNIFSRLSECFTDYRKSPNYSVEDLLKQRIYALAMGYEDLKDHDKLRNDPTLITLVGNNLAGKSTLNRLELTPPDASETSRYKKIVFNDRKVEDLFIEIFLNSFDSPPKEIILDLDATDDEIHGNQEGKHYHGYYGHYCYLPLYIFSGDFLLCAKLRKSDIDGAFGAKEEVERIVNLIRKKYPKVKILIRGDGGFSRDEIMTWCESNQVLYISGLAKNARLSRMVEDEMECAKFSYQQLLQPSRCFKSFKYSTLDSWSSVRNVVCKAEHLEKGANTRFIVTSLEVTDDGQSIYEDIYCQRGEMENRIKEMKNDLFSGRTSCTQFRPNQLRLWFSGIAYVLLNELRRVALIGTELAEAQCSTIREKLFKLGAVIKITKTKIHFHFASSYPFSKLFKRIFKKLS